MLRKILPVCLGASLILIISSCKKDEALSHIGHERPSLEVGQSNSTKSRCITDHQMQKIYETHPSYREEMIRGRLETMVKMQQDHKRSISESELLTVPVHFIVVHSPGQGEGSGENVSTARILSQLEVLNRDFLRKNADAVNTPSVFPVSNSRIQFCMASKDPNGNSTNGITRYATTQNFDNNELEIKGETSWDPTSYLNIWIAPDIEGLGYAYLPSPQSLPSRNEDGVVILTEAFGGPNSGAEAPFDLGRTVTHEVGHYLGLDHIWGEGCSVDDGISDTPQQREDNYGCPTHPSPSCGNQGDMFMNYMDYTDDHCLNAFTTGQVTYMRHILSTSRAALVRPGRTSCATGPDGTDVPTCYDGIRNGNETGVDCGGPDCEPCVINGEQVDAGVISIRQTSGSGCGGSIKLFPTIKNYGKSSINRVRILVKKGTTLYASINWTGTLAPGAQKEVAVPAFSISSGNHNLMVSTERPNNVADVNKSNDAHNITVTGGSGNQLLLVIQPDDYAADISWVVKNEGGTTVASGGGYKDGQTSQIRKALCLPDGCYRLIVKDSYGDGICCDYGEGWYELRSANEEILVESDGYYGYQETQWFCMEDATFFEKKVDRDVRDGKLTSVKRAPIIAAKGTN